MELKFSWGVYQKLRGSRPPAFHGINEIPFSEFALYAITQRFSSNEIEEIWNEIHMIDLCVVDQLVQKQDQKKKSPQ